MQFGIYEALCHFVLIMKIILCVLITFFSLSCRAFAPSRFKTWTMADGLPDNTVKCMARDRFGFLWLGTFNGLCRMDGASFTAFQDEDEVPPALARGEISALGCTNEGVWIGTRSGLFFYDFADNKFYVCHTEDRKPFRNMVKSLVAYGNMVAVLDNRGNLYKLQYDCTFRKLSWNEHWNSLAHCQGNLCWAHSYNGLYLLRLDNGTVISRFPYSAMGESEVIYYSKNQQCLFVGYGLNGKTEAFSTDLKSIKRIDSKAPLHVKAILDYGDETLFGTDGEGIVYMKQGQAYPLPANSGLGSDAVFSLIEDDKEKLFVGTYRGGLNMHTPQFDAFKALAVADGKLSHNMVTAVCKEGAKLYVGLDGGGLNIYDTQTEHTAVFNKKNSGLLGNNVLSVLSDGRFVWLGLYKEGLCRFDPHTQSFKTYPLPEDGYLWFMKDDGKGRVWISTAFKGLFLMDKQGKAIKHFPASETAVNLKDIRCLYLDSHLTLWVVTGEPKLYTLNQTKSGFSWQTVDTEIVRKKIVGIMEEKPGVFWIATYNGLFRYVEKTDFTERKKS